MGPLARSTGAARYDPPVNVVARIVLGLCGAALALYAAASLTGDWLRTPPWWERAPTANEEFEAAMYLYETDGLWGAPAPPSRYPVEGREAISIGVGAVGLTFAGFAVLGLCRTGTRQA